MLEGTLAIDSGILTLSSLETQVDQLHQQIRATQDAQDELTAAAGALANYLHEFNESEPNYNLSLYSDKLADVGRKIKGVDQTLNNAHDRLSSLQRQIAREIYKNKQKILQLSPEAVIPPLPPH